MAWGKRARAQAPAREAANWLGPCSKVCGRRCTCETRGAARDTVLARAGTWECSSHARRPAPAGQRSLVPRRAPAYANRPGCPIVVADQRPAVAGFSTGRGVSRANPRASRSVEPHRYECRRGREVFIREQPLISPGEGLQRFVGALLLNHNASSLPYC
jgi:hypothetical protein